MSKTLTVYLAADLKNFNAGLNEAERKLGGFSHSMTSMVGPAFLAAGAAAGAFAIKLGTEGVQAAIEDEASVAKLAKTLENLNMAHESRAIEDFIGNLETTYGVADTKLRPAYESLARATKDVGFSNILMSLALDISAGSGKELETVITGLSRAATGNTTSLQRMNLGLDNATLKSGDMQQITAELSRLFGGAATEKAKTYQGQLDLLKIGAENLAEAFGTGLLESMVQNDAQTITLTTTMQKLEPVMKTLGTEIGNTAKYITDTIVPLAELAGNLQDVETKTGPADIAMQALKDTVYNTVNVWRPLSGVINAATGETDLNEIANRDLTSATVAAALETKNLSTNITDLTPKLTENGKTALETAGSYKTLYERIADADRVARDFAGTSGTVSSAIASGIRNPQFAPTSTAKLRDIDMGKGTPVPTPPMVTEQAVASAIANIVLKNDARQGVAPRVPTSGMGVVFR